MPTTVNLRAILDKKTPEMLALAPASTGTGLYAIATPGNWPTQAAFYNAGTASHYLYYPSQDAWIELPGAAAVGTSSGSCGAFHSSGPTGTASAGSATTLTTTTTLPSSIAGYTVRITAGTGAGQERAITSNTFGANSILTVPTWTVTPDNTSVYLLLTGRFWCLAAAGAAIGMKYYDVATATWSTARTMTSGPGATWATDGSLVATPGALYSTTGIASGTPTSASATTITNTNKAWTVNQWANYQVRITGGTGAGKVATITSNTATQLTFPTVTTVLDASSTYVIEGNDDFLYALGNNAVTLFRYSISADTWSTLTPGVARAGAPGAGMTAHWATNVTDAFFSTENSVKNGDRIYSFRGAAGAVLDYYSISANTWVNGVSFAPGNTTFTTGSSACFLDLTGDIYYRKDTTGRYYKYNVVTNLMTPFFTNIYPDSTAVVGTKTWMHQYSDGGTTIRWIYSLMSTGVVGFRVMVI